MTALDLNLRRMFLPDPGMTIVDADIAGADAMVFAWEVGDGPFKTLMKSGAKLHVESNRFMFPKECGPDGKREPFYTKVKSAGHGTNYGGGVRTLAANLSWPEREARRFQQYWFTRFPDIRAYHRRVETQIMQRREVRNIFGYRIHFFDRIETLLPEALAWVPQSTVAIQCFRCALALRAQFPLCQLLLQVHDSLVFQLPTSECARTLPQVKELLESMLIPYPEPLQMRWAFKSSTESWGACT